MFVCIFFFQAEDGIRDIGVTGVQTCALPISSLGLSYFIFIPVFIPGPTTIGFDSKYFNIICSTEYMILGTTEDIITPSTSDGSNLLCKNNSITCIPYSSAVLMASVDNLQSAISSVP